MGGLWDLRKGESKVLPKSLINLAKEWRASFSVVEFELSVRHLNGDVEQVVENLHLPVGRELLCRRTRLDFITQGACIGGESKTSRTYRCDWRLRIGGGRTSEEEPTKHDILPARTNPCLGRGRWVATCSMDLVVWR